MSIFYSFHFTLASTFEGMLCWECHISFRTIWE